MTPTKLDLLLSIAIFTATIRALNAQIRIVGGVDANPEQYKFMVEIHDNKDGTNCGGTLINEKAILTAAHCVSFHPLSDYTVYVGSKSKGRGTKHAIVQSWIHESWLLDLKTHFDVALIRIDPFVSPSNHTSYTNLAIFPPQYDGFCYAAGWGDLYGNGTYPEYLQETLVKMIDPIECKKIENYTDINLITQFCAGQSEGGKDTCQGDSGGPVICVGPTGWEQTGITVSGMGCGLPGQPGIYNKVSYFRDWIKTKLPELERYQIPQKWYRVQKSN